MSLTELPLWTVNIWAVWLVLTGCRSDNIQMTDKYNTGYQYDYQAA